MAVRDIDVAAATQAFEEAAGTSDMPVTPSEGGFAQPRNSDGTFASPNTPAVEAPPAAEEVQTPEPTATPEQGTEEPTFTHIDDSALTPELQQMKRSLQADYTRKTQEAAPWRKLGQELGVESPEDFRQALQVYQQLQDPRNWPAITQELSQYMQQMGMNPVQAQQAAADQLASFAAPQAQPEQQYEFDGDYADSGVPPQLVQTIQAQQQQIQQLTSMFQQQEQQRQQEAQFTQIAQHLTRQENEIRAANPHYTDQDIEAIYNLMGQDGNLSSARDHYESLIGQRVQQYIQNKGQAVESTPVAVPGGTSVAAPPNPLQDPNLDATARFEAAHRAAMAHTRELERLAATS